MGPRRAPWRRLKRRRIVFAIVALAVAVEQVFFLLHNGAPATHARVALLHPATLAGRIGQQIDQALGPGDRGVRRFVLTSPRPDARHAAMYVVRLTWAVNGDLSLGSVSAGAQLDVFLVLRALFTAHTPISAVYMTGTFGEQGRHGRDIEAPVLKVGMARATARLIDWENMDANTVWPLVHRYYERPGFECNCQE